MIGMHRAMQPYDWNTLIMVNFTKPLDELHIGLSGMAHVVNNKVKVFSEIGIIEELLRGLLGFVVMSFPSALHPLT